MRVPLKTRDGVAQAPMAPGTRWLRWLPCEAPWPREVVALHPTGEALALGDGDGVDPLARLPQVGRQLLAHREVGHVVEAQLDERDGPGSTPALA